MAWMNHSFTIDLLKDILTVSSFWLLQIKLPQTIVYRYLCRNKTLFFRAKCPGMLLLSCMVSIFLIFKETAKLIFRMAVPFHIPTSNVREIRFFRLLTNIRCYHFYFSSKRWAVVSHYGLNLHFSNG